MARGTTILVMNKTGTTILANRAVRFIGFSNKNNVPLIDLASYENATTMPRTMLRYSIEKLPETQRRYYLGLS